MTEEMKKIRQEANQLKKEKKYKEAAVLYKNLWEENKHQNDGANLLHCYRKSGQFEEALELVSFFREQEAILDWLKNEIVWTLLTGRLFKSKARVQISEILNIANDILSLEPDFIPKKIAIFHVLKTAKNEGRWDIILEWVDKLDPKDLEEKPFKSPNAWSDKTLWYFYKINGLINQLNFEEAASMCDDAIPFSEKQRNIFLMLKASILKSLNRFKEAIPIYEEILGDLKINEWQDFIDYIQLLKSDGQNSKALEKLYQAAGMNKNRKIIQKIIQEIAFTALEQNDKETAFIHFILEKKINDDKKIKLSASVKRKIKELSSENDKCFFQMTKEELIEKAESIWMREDQSSHTELSN